MAKSTSSNYKTKKEAQSALTSAEAGSVGGNMVKEMIRRQEEQMGGK